MAGRGSPKLTQRNGRRLAGGKPIPKSKFALPNANGGKGAYPVDTAGRARNALARGSQNATPSQQTQIKRAVRAKFPGIAVDGKTSTSSGKPAARGGKAAGKGASRGRSSK